MSGRPPDLGFDAEPPGRGGTATDTLDLVQLSSVIRRFAAARLRDPHDVDDVVQETLVRTLAARDSLDDAAAVGYCITVARHLIASMYRDAATARRHAPKLVDLNEPPRPEAAVLAEEERRALAVALSGLPAQHQQALLAHAVDGTSLSDLAGADRAPGGVAAQLSRTRAKLRVDYLLALRSVKLPTAACRPVLMSLSSGDQRRQRATDAGAHLLSCSTCAELAPVLLVRQRALAGLLPWVALGSAHGAMARWVKSNPAQAGVAATATATAAVLTVVAVQGQPAPTPASLPSGTASSAATTSPGPTSTAPTSPAPTSPGATASGTATADPSVAGIPGLTQDGRPVPADRASLTRLRGEVVKASGVRVQSVPADEGFWVGPDANRRVWVQLTTADESGVTIRPGMRLSFSGRVVANASGFLGGLGLESARDRDQLQRQETHLSVAAKDVEVE